MNDNQKVYVDKSRVSVNIEPPFAQGSAFGQGDGLFIDISSSGDYELRLRHTKSDISSDSRKSVGKSFALAGEDYVDNDFNDICVSISAWNKARQNFDNANLSLQQYLLEGLFLSKTWVVERKLREMKLNSAADVYAKGIAETLAYMEFPHEH